MPTMTTDTHHADREHFYFNRKARDRYHLTDPQIMSLPRNKNESLKQAEEQTQNINRRLLLLKGLEVKQILPAQFNGMKLLHELFHHIIAKTVSTCIPDLQETALTIIEKETSQWHSHDYLRHFLDVFPPQEVYRSALKTEEYLNAGNHVPAVIEESYLVWLNNQNPALDQFTELLADRDLSEHQAYPHLIRAMQQVMKTAGPVHDAGIDLAELLTLPIRHAPGSILAQLRYIRLHWESMLEDSPFWNLLESAIVQIEDEDRYLFFEQLARKQQTEPGSWTEHEVHVPAYSSLADSPARYSHDASWMPEVVMIAKSTYVWLDQLSREYGKPVRRLQDIPDRELDRLAERGFTSLWLIGLWERSLASEKIKQLQGNPEAKASAYALENYTISGELGGYEGYLDLRHRALTRGIRLASDMVPNHTGIDSDLVRTRPEWFLCTPEPPYPNYSYQGPNLSCDTRYGIYIEDGYWNRSDAAVTFKRVDHLTGDVRYIYHGNDGTNMPWNDTAQLDFLNPEVREGVIQQILHVARMFPVIRFDAAMVLAKMHIQRLWYPLPGHPPGVPSRGGFSMSMADFENAIPQEFWREVVDRIQQEVPDTLLLAEAFWMLEGYFVRTLGMHRVYNSAFMHMLKKEDNASYRTLIKNTLEFDAEILKRYVNFMNNPDEDTAIAQFGKGDKYFGVCLMMATMPGLPMFGHGQVEGFTEKYGMEYSRAYYDEHPDGHLVERHYREIFPILKKRRLFAEVRHFFLYDLYTADGRVNEDVFAYTNRVEKERVLVLYNNRFEATAGWIRISAGYRENGTIRQMALADALLLPAAGNDYVIFRDHASGMEFIRSCDELHEKGLHTSLNGYQYHVFLDFREVRPSRLRPYDRVCRDLDGRGTASIDLAAITMSLAPLHRLILEALDPDRLEPVLDGKSTELRTYLDRTFTDISDQYAEIMEQPLPVPPVVSAHAASRYETALELAALFQEHAGTNRLLAALGIRRNVSSPYRHHILVLIVLDALQAILEQNGMLHDNLVDDWLLDETLASLFTDEQSAPADGNDLASLFACLLSMQEGDTVLREPQTVLEDSIRRLFEHHDRHLETFMQFRYLHGKTWFREHRFTLLLSWMSLHAQLRESTGRLIDEKPVRETLNPANWLQALEALDTKAFLSGYEMHAMLHKL
jgi:glycosidase